jgi:small-conductance mechanosensitive channel/CRP-like cAMP-binding protein
MTSLLTSVPAMVLAGLILFGLALAVRAFTKNRVVRSRVRLPMVLAVVFVGVQAALAAPDLLRPEARQLAVSVSQLLFAFALIHFLVLVVVNPLRADRVPDYFPTIVQDVLVFVLFAVVATLVMEEKFLTTSAVGAVVAGLALQDTLGNLVSGLAIQVEKPFHVGHWISSGDWEGEVTEITWRATKLRTRQGNQVIVPNGELAKAAIINYSEPASPTRIEVEVGTHYNNPPNVVKRVILDVLDREPLVLKVPAPVVHVMSFDASSILHRARFWIQHYPMDEIITDRVRTAIYYAFKRENVEIPYPIAIEYGGELEDMSPDTGAVKRAEALLAATDLFGLLSAEDRQALVAAAPLRLFGDGEILVRQGEAGHSAFVVFEGRVRVSLDPGDVELARLDRGAYFGEMSLLTGDPRTASVRAVGDCTVLEITSDAFRGIVLQHPALVERIGVVVAERRAGIARARAAVASVPAAESATSLVARVRRFFRL